MQRINERTTLALVASFYDAEAATTTPTIVRYRIDDDSSGSEVLGWTNATPSSAITISVTATQNQLVNRSNTVERRTVTVQADHGLSSEWSGEYQFEIARLNGVP